MQVAAPTPQWKKDEVVRLYTTTFMSVKEACERVGLSPQSGTKILREAGVKTTSRLTTPYDTQLELVRLYTEEDIRVSDAAARVGINKAAATRILKLHGVEVRIGGRTPRSIEREIVHLYVDENLSCVEIAETFGSHPDTVRNVLRRHGITVFRRGGKPGAREHLRTSAEIANEVVRLYTEEFKSRRDIAEVLPVSPSTVGYILKRAGIRPRPRSWGNRFRHVPPSEIEKVIEAVDSGMSVREAAAHLGITEQTVYYRLSVAGVKPPTKPRVTHRQVLQARFLYFRKKLSYAQIGREMGISASRAQRYVQRRPDDPTLQR